MADPISFRHGQCRCGKLQFEVMGGPLITMVCHCLACQQMTSSAYSLSELFGADAFKVTGGELVIGGLRGGTRHYFCEYCMTWLFTRPEGMNQFVNVRATLLQAARSFVPFLETYTDEMLPWARTPAVHSFATFPPPERYPQLVADYARHCR